MSGICAFVGKDGRPVDPARFGRIMGAISYRGPDGQDCAATSGALIGHSFLATERSGPKTGTLRKDNNIIISADSRLDNREDLVDLLGVAPGADDAEILIASYRRWGEAMGSHLLGDFAFVIWDEQAQQLFAARDHFGVKPFYYAHDSRYLVVCSDLAGIFASRIVGGNVREAAIADFLLGLTPAQNATSYEDIWRLPPGHFCVLSGGVLRVSAYWTLALPDVVNRKDAPEEFRAILSQAVEARQRGGQAACMLSGGLDSSSISCLAARLQPGYNPAPIQTFSLVFDKTPEKNERPYIESVLRCGKFSPVFIASDNVPPFAELDALLSEQQDLFLGPNMACSRQLLFAARARGVRVMLDGHGGDEVAPVGSGRLFQLAAAGKWLDLWRQLSESTLGPSEGRVAAYWHLLGYFSPLRKIRRFPLARRLLWHTSEGSSTRFLSSGLVARTGVADRLRQKIKTDQKQSSFSEQINHFHTITDPLQSYALEMLNRTAAAAHVDVRYPFWDKRLVEFCLSLAPSEKLDHGWGRWVLRRGMEGVLPTEVQWRTTKFNFLHHLAKAMIRNHTDLIDDILMDRDSLLASYVDLPKVRDEYHRLRENVDSPDGFVVQGIWRIVVLAGWLKRQNATGLGFDLAQGDLRLSAG